MGEPDPTPDPDPSPRPPEVDSRPPAWFVRSLAALLALLSATSVVGLLAAMAGAFEPPLVVAGTLVLGLPLAAAAATALPRWSSSRSTHLAAALLLALVAASTLYNARHHGEHVVADRDPGVYLTTARHLAEEGDLLVDGPSGPFRGVPGLSPNGVGFTPTGDDGALEPQFPHLTAVVLALGGWVDDAGLFLVTPVVAGGALLCLYAWAATVVGPRWALGAAAVAGLTIPFLVFARDAYSEPIAMLLLFGGLWMLDVARRGSRPVVWLVAGLLIGASSMARVDGYLYLAPVLLALSLAWRLSGGRRRSERAGVGLAALGVAITSSIGFWDTATLTGEYYEADLAGRWPPMVLAGAAAAVAGWFLAPLLWRRTDPASPGVEDAQPTELEPTRWLQGGLLVGAAASAGFFAWAYWVRPDAAGVPPVAVEGIRVLSYLEEAATLSLHWLQWYLGPLGLAVGLAGLLWSVLRLGRVPGPDPTLIAGLGCVMVPLLLYLWSPNVTPDQPWAMRRFAVAALPGLAVGAAAIARALWAAGRGRGDGRWGARPVVLSTLAIVAMAGTIASTAAISYAVRGVRAQEGMQRRIEEICDTAGDDAAILVPIDGVFALMMSVPVGVWCGVPSAGGVPGLEPVDVARLALEWEEQGRKLVVLSSSPTPLFNELRPTGLVDEPVILAPVFPQAIEPSITNRPRRVVVDGRLGKGPGGSLDFYLFEVDLDVARAMVAAAGLGQTASAGSDSADLDSGR